jgi:O-antigen biosynthesis protein
VLFATREPAPLPANVSEDPSGYATWVTSREAERRSRAPDSVHQPELALVTVVPAPVEGLARTLQSIAGQTSRTWSLTILVSETSERHVENLVTASPRTIRRRTRILNSGGPADVFVMFNEAIDLRRGCHIALIFPGDVWAPDAVALLASQVTPTNVVYADEDALGSNGVHTSPRLKPEYSPDFLASAPYIGRPLVIGSAVTRDMPRIIASAASSLEHACALTACEVADRVVHIPEVLCHRWAAEPAEDPDCYHVEVAIERTQPRATERSQPRATVRPGSSPGTFHVIWPDRPRATVSVVIPFRDEPRLLRTCVDSVSRTARHDKVELVLVDNGSTDLETQTLMERLETQPDVRVLHDARPFNWARLSNDGARAARGEVLIFLNNDIEARMEGWIAALRAQALRSDVAAVGARLLYPDGRLQHCGIVLGLNGAAGHPLAGLAPGQSGYLQMASVTRECSAVTGACLAVRREVFEQLDGFDEGLGVDLNDVDFCLRAWDAGFRTLYEPAAELVHHESPSRGTAGGVGDIVSFLDRWEDRIRAGDRYLNPHLTRSDPSCRLASASEAEQWDRWHSTVRAQ